MFGGTGEGFVRFKLFGIPVGIDWSFLIVPLMVLAWGGGWQLVLIWTGGVFVSVLLHELGHAIAMRVFKFAPRVSIYALGGLTFWPEGAAPTVRQRFIVSGSGPAISITLGTISWVLKSLGPWSPTISAIIEVSIWINLIWGAINLLPLMPLDGGNLLDTGATIVTGTPRPRWVGVVSIVTGLGVIVGAARFEQPFIGIIGVFAILRGWERWKDKRPDFDQALKQAIALGWSGNREGAETILLMLKQVATTDEQRARVAQELAWLHLMNGKPEAAAELVRTLPSGWQVAPELKARLLATKDDVDGVIAILMPEVTNGHLAVTAAPLLASALFAQERLQEVEAVATLMLANAKTREDAAGRVAADLTARLFHANATESCLRLSEFLWKKFSKGEDAFNAACALVKLSRPDEAMRWLSEAVRAGMPKLREALTEDHDLAPLRERPEFAALLTRAQ
ncbi:MAG: site-2 protease family protein [Myxococcales bacterium]|nr:site-2 protease family protein [Myxococcales bacterium]